MIGVLPSNLQPQFKTEFSTHSFMVVDSQSHGREIELDSRMVFALVESRNISLTLGQFKKGVEQFQQALEIFPDCVHAQYKLALGLLSLATDCINLGAYQWGTSLLEGASKVSIKSAHSFRNISCIWKLHADIQLAYARCNPWIQEVQKLESNKEAFSTSIISWRKTYFLAAIHARFSYQRALHLSPWQAKIYSHIGVISYLITSLSQNYKQNLSAQQLGERMPIGALVLEGDNYEFGVALGCLSYHNAQNQHALIRRLQVKASLAVSWGYLGKLYFKAGKKQLAMQVFDHARSINPDLAFPWASCNVSFILI